MWVSGLDAMCGLWSWAGEEEGFPQLPETASAAVRVTSRIRAIKVWILTAHEAAMLVVLMKEAHRQIIPCVSHDSLDGSFGDWAAHAAQLLPIVKQRVVQWREALGSVWRHE